MTDIIFTDNNKQDIVIAWTVALLVHVLFFSLTGKMFIKPPQFAIAPSREIDINLIDEPKEVIQVQQVSKPVIKKIEKTIPKLPMPIARIIEKPKQLIRPKQIMTSRAEVKEEAKPDYIQNPPPPYPLLAKQMRQEGIVMLSVDVSKEGNPVNIIIFRSSGYRLLDQAALRSVRHWKFQPGSLGNIPVESTVFVPIRFRIEK